MSADIINTSKLTDIRKVRTVEDLWAYQPPYERDIQDFDPRDLPDIIKRATSLLGEDGTDEWVCLVSVLWAARIYRDQFHFPRGAQNAKDTIRALRSARPQPKGGAARKEFTAQNKKLAQRIRLTTWYLLEDKGLLEEARDKFVHDRHQRQPAQILRSLPL